MSSRTIDFYGSTLNVYKANLHTHSTVSDGRFTPQEVIDLYQAKGYDALALTDHRAFNSIENCDSKGLCLIHGIELHPAGPHDSAWHLLCLGVKEGDVPGDTAGMTPQQVIDRVKAAGGLVFAAHPYWCGFQYDQVMALEGLSGTEVWNTSCRYIGKAFNMQIWDDMLMHGKKYTALAVDDTHKELEAFFGWTMICAQDDSEKSLLEALEKGHFYSSMGPEFFKLRWENGVLEAEYSPCREVNVLTSANRGWPIRLVEEKTPLSTGFRLELPQVLENPGTFKYLRIQIIDENGKYAWSMPVFVS